MHHVVNLESDFSDILSETRKSQSTCPIVLSQSPFMLCTELPAPFDFTAVVRGGPTSRLDGWPVPRNVDVTAPLLSLIDRTM